MARLDDDSTEPLRPEELDDETWADVLERVEEGAQRAAISGSASV